ncbi:MAG: prenyltransferase/squalene oxidase repeat-containing protein [Planctomycetota bacterium]
MATARIGRPRIALLYAACTLMVVALPPASGQAPPNPDLTAQAPQPDVDGLIAESLSYLLRTQNADGSWGTHRSKRPAEVMAAIPGSHEAFRVATSALCFKAVCDATARRTEARSAETQHVIERGLDYLIRNAPVKRASAIEHYNVWSFGFGLEALAEFLIAHPTHTRGDEIRATCRELVRKLALYQTLDGGWGYYSFNDVPTFRPSDTSMSFTTATILVGLDRARKAGIEIAPKVLEQAVSHVERSRTPAGSFLYGEYLKYVPRHGVNQIKGSACRTPACQYSLRLFERGRPVAEETSALEDLWIRHARFQQIGVRRPIPHESWYAISGYFYLYGQAYGARLLRECPPDVQARLWPRLIEAVTFCRQPDGSYWDYPLYDYHSAYGTAFALIALACVPITEAPSRDE